MNLISLVLIFLPVALANSDAEKWSWPSSSRDQRQADKRNDIYDDKANDNEKVGRIRVPTSFDNRRPLQPYQVKEPTNNRPKPLSDEFSNEFTASGESFNGNRPQQSVNTPNRVGAQQANDFGFGGGFPGAYPGAGGYQGGFPGQGFPGQGGYHQGGFPGQGGFHQGGGFPGQFGGAYPGQFGGNGGFGGQHNLANGVLVGPGGPTGIIGRPYGGYPPQFGHGGIYGGQHGGHGINPYGGGYNPAFGGGGGFPGPYFDQPDNKPQGKQNLQANKIEKSA